jgi:hypothetical protein
MFDRRWNLKIHMLNVHGLLIDDVLPSRQQTSPSDHDSFSVDNCQSTSTGQGLLGRRSPGSEHREAQAEIADWYQCEELVEKSAGQGLLEDATSKTDRSSSPNQ